MTKEVNAASEAPKPEDVKVEVIGDILPQVKEAQKKVVPEAAFLELKTENKQLRKAMKELQTMKDSGADKDEISDEIEELGEEFGVDKTFLRKLNAINRKAFEKDNAKVESRIQPLEAKEQEERIETVFSKHYGQAIADMPEYKEIVNRDVIKALSLIPANKDKTFKQLIEETYSHSIKGKQTLSSTTPRADEGNDEQVDIKRMNRDPKYYDEVMKNPRLKAAYNKDLFARLKL